MAVVGSAYVIVRAITTGLGKDIEKSVERELGGGGSSSPVARVGDKVGRSFWRGFTKGNNDPDRNGRSFGQKFGNSFSKSLAKVKVKPLWLLALFSPTLIGGAIKLLVSYASSVVDIIGALGPAIAGGAAFALTGVLALGQGMITLKQAFAGTDAASKANKKTLQEFNAKIFTPMQKIVAKGLAPVLKDLGKTLVPQLSRAFAGTGHVLVGVIKQFDTLSKNPLFRREFGATLGNNNKILANLGTVLINVVRTVIAITSAAGPFVIQFSKWLAGITGLIAKTAEASGKSGGLTAFFDRAAKSLAQLGRIVADFGVGLFNVFKAAAPAGQTLLDRIEALGARFRAWTGSITGQNKLKKYFDDALPVIHEVNGLFGDLFRLLGQSLTSGTGNKGVLTFVRSLRTEVVPAIAGLAKALSGQGPALQGLVTSLTNFLTVAGQSGAIGAFTSTLSKLLDIISTILQLPVIGKIAAWALAFVGIAKAIQLVIGEKAFGFLFGLLVDFAQFIGGVLIDALLWLGRVLVAIFVGADPIVLAIVAIVSVLVLLYTKVQWFRDGVNAAFFAVWHAINSAFHFIVDAAITGWNAFVAVASKVWGVIVGVISTAWGVITAVFSAAFTAITAVFNVWWSIFYGIWSRVFIVLLIPVRILEGLLILLFEGIFNAAKFWFGLLWQFVTFVWNTIVQATQAVLGVVVPIVTGIFTAVFNAVRGPLTTVWSFITTVWHGIITVTSTVLGTLIGVIKTIFGTIATTIGGIFDGLKVVVSGAWTFIGNAANAVVGVVTSIINVAITIIDAFIDGLNAVINLANKLPGVDIPTISQLQHIGVPAAPGSGGGGRNPKQHGAVLAEGGVARATPGGIMARIAEAGQNERVEPLDSRGLSKRDHEILAAIERSGGGRSFTFHTQTMQKLTPQEAAEAVAWVETLYGGGG